MPFNFNKAKLANVSGKESRNLPATAKRIARTINPKIIKNLRPLDIFLDEILLIKRSKK